MAADASPSRTKRKSFKTLTRRKRTHPAESSTPILSVNAVLEQPQPLAVGKSYLVAPHASKLNSTLVEQFCQLAERGVAATTICDYLGVSYGALREWLDKGEKYLAMNGEADPSHELHATLVLSLKRAGASYCIALTEKLNDDLNDHWYKSVVVLERRDRKNWGKEESLGGGDDQFSSDERFS